MCSCSGSCNCNSTTIPRGPQGTPGTNGTSATVTVGSVTPLPAGAAPTVTNSGTNPSAAVFNFGIPAGATGGTGSQGNNGINAFTTLTDDFVQPAINDDVIINVVNNSWVALGEIIYIGPGIGGTPLPGGFYQVINTTSTTQITVVNLGWTIPGTTFASQGQAVGTVGTTVTPSGTIGPDGLIRKVLDETSSSAVEVATGVNTAELDWLYNGLNTNQDTLSFEFEIEPNSGNGRFQFVTLSVANTTVSSFTFSGAGGAAALVAARINFSTAPSSPTPGYVSSSDETISEDINFIRGFVRITRSTNTGVDVKVEYLMCNKYVQRSYGTSQETYQVQKHFIGTKRVTAVPDLTINPLLIEIDATPEAMDLATYGAEITIKNAIKLSSIL